MTRVRLEALQWFALLGGALAWASQHVVGFYVSSASCTDSVTHTSAIQIAVSAVVVLAILCAEAAAFVVFRATRSDGPPPSSRLHFFAEAALLGNVLFLCIVILSTLSTVYHLPCAES